MVIISESSPFGDINNNGQLPDVKRRYNLLLHALLQKCLWKTLTSIAFCFINKNNPNVSKEWQKGQISFAFQL